MTVNARLIGGSHAGKVVAFEGRVVRLIKSEDLTPPAPSVTPTTIDASDINYEVYVLDEVNFSSGHKVQFAILENMRLVDAMHLLWEGYSKASHLENVMGDCIDALEYRTAIGPQGVLDRMKRALNRAG